VCCVDLVNTKERVLPVCDETYHTNKGKLQKGKDVEVLHSVWVKSYHGGKPTLGAYLDPLLYF